MILSTLWMDIAMLYENDNDRREQLRLSKCFARSRGWSGTITPQDKLLPWDAEYKDERGPVAIAEIKRRNVRLDTYSTYMIDKHKIDALLEEAEQRSVHAVVVVGFNDAVVSVVVTREWLEEKAWLSWMRRQDRAGESRDRVYEWSNDLFVQCEETTKATC